VTIADLRGEDAAFNAGVVRQVLAGEEVASRETVLLNAATGLVADGTLPGTAEGPLVDRLRAGMEIARRAVDEGAAAAVLERWRTAAA
jgi:anthranilate phosphoribosyltransferase